MREGLGVEVLLDDAVTHLELVLLRLVASDEGVPAVDDLTRVVVQAAPDLVVPGNEVLGVVGLVPLAQDLEGAPQLVGLAGEAGLLVDEAVVSVALLTDLGQIADALGWDDEPLLAHRVRDLHARVERRGGAFGEDVDQLAIEVVGARVAEL